MQIKKFEATNMNEALKMVKNDLKNAQKLLNKAQIIAEEKKLGNLIEKVKKEKKTLELYEWGSRKGDSA